MNLIKRHNIIILSILICFFIMVNSFVQKQNITYDPLFSKQWYLYNDGICEDVQDNPLFCNCNTYIYDIDIDYEKLYSHTVSPNNKVTVAIIDTGINYEHEDLCTSIWKNEYELINDHIDNDNNGYIDDIYGWNFCDDNNNIKSFKDAIYENDHGTMIAGIIGASHNNIGVNGIGNQNNINIMCLKVLDGLDKTGHISNIIEAIKYAEKMGAKVCNMSFNTDISDELLKTCIKNSNMLFICSSGNDAKNIDNNYSFPASYNLNNTIVVGTLDSTGNIYSTSNWGINTVDILAPGTNIYNTSFNHYNYDTGSSMSTAIVSGIAAVIWSQHGDWNYLDVKNAILNDYIITNPALKEYVSEGRILKCK